MPVLFMTALECITTEDYTHADSCRLEVRVDGGPANIMNRDLNNGERWLLNRSYSFMNEIRIKLFDEDWPDADDFLGEVVIGSTPRHRAIGKFTLDGADYSLWYEVFPSDSNRVQFHRPQTISLRRMLSRVGRGVLTQPQHNEIIQNALIYRCSEYISFQDTKAFHAKQDKGKGNTQSVRMWIYRHCNPWGEESVIPINQTPRSPRGIEIFFGQPQWLPVTDEKSYCVAGFQHYSRRTKEDYPFTHETMDWNWTMFLDAPFIYMLDYTASTKALSGGNEYPYIDNEWETGSLPIQWRPFWGEHVFIQGRHIFDAGHMPVKTEIHPCHTIVREHTTAAPLGNGGAMVPVNRAIIGMGVSGGFPGDVGSRWQDETGANPPNGIWGDTTDCWVTNLKLHPLKFQLFPPVPRPSPTAVLRARVVLSEYIQVPDWDEVDDFLELCQNDDPADGGDDLAFRVWNRSARLPVGFVPVVAPAALQPKFTLQHDAYFDVEVDLTPASQIPVGYYAIVECGWSEPGGHVLSQFEVTFETVKAVETEETWDDWHMYYGVNGQWAAWWTDDFVEKDKTYTHNRIFRIWTVDDLPILIRDCGIEWDGFDSWNEYMDRVEITVPGPDYFNGIVNHPGVDLISQVGNTLRVKAKGWEMNPGDTKHEWTLRIVRL